ncbi:ABC transporter permease subunit [Tengunoibacter tsumagoiensis]|uniref:ABC transporter permease n=1 Tax=Tengunoibacter tsumagoiensis TaxID=2014871 RepID=A0A402A4Q7_9CHLR|nr:ABC transporter permease subunit [Tengunoibacter tsumagoiensis]GCE14046.1 hypothetical protein KTT_39050 [Tengunoibacter tsumagoiensis]
MFHTVWSKTLRDYRFTVLYWGLGLGLVILAVFATFSSQYSSQGGDAGILELAQSLKFIADPIALQTIQGYATWRLLGFFVPSMLAIWAVLAGANLVRGEEERRASDLLLSVPLSRTRYLLEKYFALISALLGVGLLIALGAIIGEASAKVEIEAGRALLAGLDVSLYAIFFASLSLLLSQCLRSRGAAAGWAGGIIAYAFVLDGTGRTIQHGEWLQRLSPLYYYSQNKPLISSFSNHPEAALLLIGLTLLFSGLSFWLYTQRDLGGVAFAGWSGALSLTKPLTRQQSLQRAWKDISVRSFFTRTLQNGKTPALWWIISLLAYAGWITTLTTTMLDPIRKLLSQNSPIAQLLSGHDITTNAGFLAYAIYQFLPALATVFIFTLALKWASTLDSGRLELVLSTPVSRVRLLLQHAGALFVYALIIPILAWPTVVISAHLSNLAVDSAKVMAASLSILPLELVLLTFVYAVAGRLRSSIITGLVGTYLAVAFMIDLLRSLLHLPDWVQWFSILYAYGSPIQNGWRWGTIWSLLALSAALLMIGVIQFQRNDVDRGNA